MFLFVAALLGCQQMQSVDQNARQVPSFSSGKDSADIEAVVNEQVSMVPSPSISTSVARSSKQTSAK